MRNCLKLRGKSGLTVFIILGFLLIAYLISFPRWLDDFHTYQRHIYSTDDIQQLLARLHSSKGPALRDRDNQISRDTGPHLKPTVSKEECLSPVTNIAYIKTHKTGSTTLSHIINRYGYQRNLSFILDKYPKHGRKLYLDITVAFQNGSLLRPLRTSVLDENTRPLYNITALHMQYDRNVTDKFMVPNSRYITSLRDPAAQFESAFAHYKFDKVFGKVKNQLTSKPIEDSIAEWLTKPEFYLSKLRRTVGGSRPDVELIHLYARNGQMNDLGFEYKHQGNLNKVSEYIASLDKDFDLVLITEYFDESLLILKKQFCWEVEDILYISENQRSNLVKLSVSESLRDSIRKWNSADFQLYQHFNRTLWQKIQNYGPQFREDLINFRKRLKEVLHDCTNGEVTKGRKFFRRTVYTKKKNSPDYCDMLVKTKDEIVLKIREKQSENHVNH